jgi:hypothetical protein
MYRLKGYCKRCFGAKISNDAVPTKKKFFILSKYNQRVNIAIGSFFCE